MHESWCSAPMSCPGELIYLLCSLRISDLVFRLFSRRSLFIKKEVEKNEEVKLTEPGTGSRKQEAYSILPAPFDPRSELFRKTANCEEITGICR